MNVTLLSSLFSLLSTLALLTAPARGQCTTVQAAAYTEVYGASCGTPPSLGVTANPVLGTTMALRTTNLPVDAVLVGVAVSFVPPGIPTNNLMTIPLGTGCNNYVPGAVDIVLAFPLAGAADVVLGIPASSQMQGTVVHAQSFVLTMSGGFSLPHASNAICLYCGQ